MSTFSDWIDALKPGDLVGRYVVRGLLGAGGMGVVLEAFDPMLDRRIALKVLRHGAAPSEVDASSSRTQQVGANLLMREANGMAQLSHPNVMPIFDVGWIDGRFFLAMELNVGLTLSGWLHKKVRSWRDIVAIMVQAADGLAAIHAVGLIHCDFKPGNVLIDTADHLRIADFGLAKRIDAPQRRSTVSFSPHDPSQQETSSGTRSRGHAGTLSYMAPEQHRGDPLDPRCDQFAFFVTLYEALFDRLPFRGEGHDELLERIADAAQKDGFYRGKRQVPKWLIETLQQGLAFEPDARFSDMTRVSVALQHGLLASKKRPLYWSLCTGGAFVTAVAAAKLATSTVDPCDMVPQRAATVWNEAVEHDLAQRFLGSALTNAAVEWEKVRAQLHDQIAQWTQVASQQCRMSQSSDVHGQRCLDAALVGIGSATRVLLTGNDQTLNEPANVLAVIPDPQACFTTSGSQVATATPWPQDPQSQEAVAKLRDQILHLQMLGRAGNLTGVHALYADLVKEARALNYFPVWAELEFHTALGLAQFLELSAARAHFERAHLLAEASGHDDILGWTLASEVYSFAYLSGEGDTFGEKKALARAVLQRLHDPPLLMAEWLNNVGIVELNTGQVGHALARFRSAKALAGNLRGHSYLSSAERLNNIAISLQASGLVEQSQALLLQGLKDLLNADGTRRTRAGMLLVNLGRSEILLGRYRQAENWLIEALQIGARVAGRMASDAEFSCGNLQWLYDLEGRMDKALYVSRLCPGKGISFQGDRDLAAMQHHLFEVRALLAAGYRHAAILEFEKIDRLRVERNRSIPDVKPYLLVQLYRTAQELQLFKRAIELHHELVAWLGQSGEQTYPLLEGFDLEVNLIRLHFSQHYAALLQDGLFGTESPTLRAIADRFEREYYHTAASKGPSHPENLDHALAYLDVLQAADRQRDFGRFLDNVMQEHEHWAKEIPRRQLALVLKALNFAAHARDWPRASLHFDQYMALRDFALDDASAIVPVLRNLKQALDTEPSGAVPWADVLGRELNFALKVATQRQREPYSQALIDQVVDHVAKDPAIARLAAFRFQ